MAECEAPFRLIDLVEGDTEVCYKSVDRAYAIIPQIITEKSEVLIQENESFIIRYIRDHIIILIKGYKFAAHQTF